MSRQLSVRSSIHSLDGNDRPSAPCEIDGQASENSGDCDPQSILMDSTVRDQPGNACGNGVDC